MPVSYIEAKQALLDILDLADGDGRLDEGSFEALQSTIGEMEAVSPVPDPIDRPDKVDGSWATLFASFGPRHSAGKPQIHTSSLRLQSFNALPDMPIQVTHIYQEIDSKTHAYNNIVDFDTMDGRAKGSIIVTGNYRRDDSNLKRFHVVFTRAQVVMNGASDDQIRSALGLPEDAVIDGRFKASKIHSDIVYLDDDMRVNRGSLGGTYVLKRRTEPCISI